MKCADVRDQLVDFLYGELPASARSAFDEHVRGCAACQAEVQSHQRTLGQARKALAGPLAQEPPARVHAAVLAAAREAATARKRSAAKEELGFFTRFWRTPWFLPAFGAVSVATVVFLVKVLKNPDVIPGQHAHSLDEVQLAPAVARPATPPPASEPAAAPAAAAKPEAKDDRLRPTSSDSDARFKAGGKRVGAPAAETERAYKRKAPASGMLDGLAPGADKDKGRGFAAPPPRPATKASRDVDDLLKSFDGPSGAAAPQPAAKPAAAKKSAGYAAPSSMAAEPEFADAPLGGIRQRNYAAPPPPRAPAPAVVPAPARAPAPEPAAASPSYAPTATAGPPPAPAPSPARRMKQAEARAEEAPAEAWANDAVDTMAKQADHRAEKAAPSIDETIRKADRLFAAANWSGAAEAYRELLRRFPSHKDAPKWRERINQSVLAEEHLRRANEAKAAKARATDAAKGARD